MATECYPISRPVRVAEPTAAQEPITLAQAKHQCKIPAEVSDHDEALQRLIVSARQQVEADCAVVCYTGSFTWNVSEFPGGSKLELPDVRPVTSITSITSIDSTGSAATMTASYYGLENGYATPYVKLAYGNVWPTHRGDINGITVTYVAGFASVAVLPERIRQAVLLQVNIQWNDSLEMDTAKMHVAYMNHVRKIRTEVYG